MLPVDQSQPAGWADLPGSPRGTVCTPMDVLTEMRMETDVKR